MGGQSPAAVAYQSPSQSRRHGRDSPGVQRRRSRGHLGDDAFRRGSAKAASIRGAAHRGRHGRHSYGEPRGRVQVLLPAVHVRGKRIAYFSLLIEGCGVFPHTREPGAYIPHAYTPRQAQDILPRHGDAGDALLSAAPLLRLSLGVCSLQANQDARAGGRRGRQCRGVAESFIRGGGAASPPPCAALRYCAPRLGPGQARVAPGHDAPESAPVPFAALLLLPFITASSPTTYKVGLVLLPKGMACPHCATVGDGRPLRLLDSQAVTCLVLHPCHAHSLLHPTQRKPLPRCDPDPIN